MKCRRTLVALMTLTVGLTSRAPAEEVSALRLAPFPKKISLQEGTFSLDRELVLEPDHLRHEEGGRVLRRQLVRQVDCGPHLARGRG